MSKSVSLDLHNNQYEREILKQNIYALKLIDILKTQKLDTSFIARYILNDSYQFEEEDKIIDVELVLKLQPHIKKCELLDDIYSYDSDDDSLEDFESFSNRHDIRG